MRSTAARSAFASLWSFHSNSATKRILLAVGLGVIVAALIPSIAGARAPAFDIVYENTKFSTLAVDGANRSFGLSTANTKAARYTVYRSTNEGHTWHKLSTITPQKGSGIRNITVLSNDDLVAHVDQGANFFLYRSTDHGASWTKAFTFPTSPFRYRTLTAHSVTDDGNFVYVGSYTTQPGNSHPNWIWRFGINDSSWTNAPILQTTNHRHIHFVQYNPHDGRVYVGYGDTDAAAEITYSDDQGSSWHAICFNAGQRCRAVDIAFDNADHAIFGMDTTNGAHTKPLILRMDLAGSNPGMLKKVGTLPNPSYSAFRLADGTFLVGTTHEPCCKDDGKVHLFSHDDGIPNNPPADQFKSIFARRYLAKSGIDTLFAQNQYASGRVPIRINGYGTIVVRERAPGTPPPPPYSAPQKSFHTPNGRHVCTVGKMGDKQLVLKCWMPHLAQSVAIRGWWMNGTGFAHGYNTSSRAVLGKKLGKGKTWKYGSLTCHLSTTGATLKCHNASKHGWSLKVSKRHTF